MLPAGGAQFNGSIAGNVLSVTSMLDGSAPIALGDTILGQDVAYGTYVSAFDGTGSGGAGTYTVSIAQTAGDAADTRVFTTGVEVIQAQDNRVPEPVGSDYVTMTPLRRPRLGTNVDTSADVTFTASIDGNTMTVTEMKAGELAQGSRVFGTGVAAGTLVQAFGSGTGGIGAYLVSPAQQVASEAMAAGTKETMESVQLAIQVDVYGPNSGNFAQIMSTLFRDEYGVSLFAALSPAISPLYADAPRQLALSDGEQQYENRWLVDVELQVDETVIVPQQFADTLKVNVVSAAGS
ncbi:hypothetical protein [Bradyrhizobium sp. STM 3843]|uniref:phage neck terminator protein n=1 Tax=Bradyrhizobium sp. STM 3843 TaxID=551947 RepID=UPI001112C38A|nr:hypothetical protein [Bradyrhizobium sp. STM 3843]